MGGTVLPRLVAAAFLLLAIVVATIELGRDGEEARPDHIMENTAGPPLQDELQRCQALGEAAVRDAACLDVWAENRRRFLSPGSPQDGAE
ncbi:putative entry exclusion protein TrbK-alt [Rhodophyticola porphyridii]|uniref:putative entry exclusion protein TrbK-alt n=1 Tax=Rhodophyticola porphyridii TaxID=1852017 RepID=UPI0035D0E848